MVVKQRRLSPTTISDAAMESTMSVGTTSSSTSTALNSESGHDQILPLYSELSPGAAQAQHHHHHHHHPHHRYSSTSTTSMSMSVSMSAASTGSYDDDDLTFYDDASSTCSSHHQKLLSRIPPQQPYGSTTSNPFRSSFYSRSSNGSVSSEPCLPYWRNNHHNNGAEPNAGTSNTTSTFVFTAKKRKNPVYALLVAAFLGLGMFLYSQSHATLHDALEQVLRLTEHRRKVRAQFNNVEQDIRRLQRQMMKLSTDAAAAARLEQQHDHPNSSPSSPGSSSSTSTYVRAEEIQTLQDKLKEGSLQIGTLQKHLQDISKADAMLKYGSGKIRVQLELDFPDSYASTSSQHSHNHLKQHDSNSNDKNNHNNNSNGPNTIVMEMAPLDKMPHSVYMFLEMVNAQLFDGCSFILNAMHVIKAAPLPYDGTSSAAAKVRSFAQKGLDSVAFKEYSPDFPHSAYTVAFAADESPSFYINTQDNSDIHIGEPCFAKIIEGLDTVQRMEAAPTRNGIWYRQRIGIKRAYIL